jgi:magnesium chelatase family protein
MPNVSLADLPPAMSEAVESIRAAIARDAAGISIVGPPGIGATMLARRTPLLMPELEPATHGYLTAIYHVAGIVRFAEEYQAGVPFRAPHPTVSTGALGVRQGRVGEAQLASFGVLFLDELPEFTFPAIASLGCRLREMGRRAPFLVTSSSPCPCGYRGSTGKHRRQCLCADNAIERYLERRWRYLDALGIDDDIVIPGIALADFREVRG